MSAPDETNLARLYGMMCSFIAEHESGKLRPISDKEQPPPPKYTCDICGRPWGISNLAYTIPMEKTCQKCQEMLDEGYSAMICMELSQYAFLKSQHLCDENGKGLIYPVAPETFRVVIKTLQQRAAQSQSENITPNGG